MKLLDLPMFAWAHERRDVKVLRHHDKIIDLWKRRRENTFEDYQNGQSWDVFGKAKYVLSFVSERNRFAKFVGVWEVLSNSRLTSGQLKYKTSELPGYGDLEGRLVIEWGSSARTWAQWAHGSGNKIISEILPRNYVMDFPGFYNIKITYDQLSTMIANPDANREWQRMLSSVSGVYVILDQDSGKQYIGSAYGKGGIWGRWSSYATSPSGGNRLLNQLLMEKPKAASRFQFAVLRVLEAGATRDDVLTQEKLTKSKLGSRAFGLNGN
jgi:hypothetical protein